MARFSPSVSMGTYNRPNYLANALQDISGTALDLMAERRRANRDIAEREDQQAFRQGEMDRDFAYRSGRDAIGDQRYAAETDYAQGRDRLMDTRYDDTTQWNRVGAPAAALARDTERASSLAAALGRLNPDAGQAMTGVISPDVVEGLLGRVATDKYVTDPGEIRGNARGLDLYRGKAQIDRQFAGQGGGQRIQLADGTVGIITPQGIQRLGMVGGGQQPTKPLPQSAGGRVPTTGMMNEHASITSAIQQIDEMIGPDGQGGLLGTPIGERAVSNKNLIPRILLPGFLEGKAMNVLNPEGADVRAALSDISSRVRKDRLGGAITPTEYRTLEPLLAEADDKPEVARQKLNRLRQNLQTLMMNKDKVYQASGYRSMGGPDPLDEEIDAVIGGGGG